MLSERDIANLKRLCETIISDRDRGDLSRSIDITDNQMHYILKNIYSQRKEFLGVVKTALSFLDSYSFIALGSSFYLLRTERARKVLNKMSDSKNIVVLSFFKFLKNIVSVSFYDLFKGKESDLRKFAVEEIPAREDKKEEIPKENIKDGADYRKDVRILAHAIVVGSGAGGSVIASKLSEEGLCVAILEEGKLSDDLLNLQPFGAIANLYRDFGVHTNIFGSPKVQFVMGKCVGGTTMINFGSLKRMSEDTIKNWIRNLGFNIPYSLIEEYYKYVEEMIGVTEPIDMKKGDVKLLKFLSDYLNLEFEHLTKFANNGCGKGTANNLVKNALFNGTTLYTRFRARKIAKAKRRWMVSGDILDEKGNPQREFLAEADILVLSTGAIYTPLILKRSGFTHNHLGRGMKIQPTSLVFGFFDDKIESSFAPQSSVIKVKDREIFIDNLPMPKSLFTVGIHGFADEISDYLEKYENAVSLSFRFSDEGSGVVIREVFGFPLIRYNFSPVDNFRFFSAVRFCCQMLMEAGAKEIIVPIKGFQTVKNMEDVSKIDNIKSKYAEVFGFSPTGTIRTSYTSEIGMVSSVGKVYGQKGLFIADASVLPSSEGYPPQLTIMAMSSLCADFIMENMDKLIKFKPEPEPKPKPKPEEVKPEPEVKVKEEKKTEEELLKEVEMMKVPETRPVGKPKVGKKEEELLKEVEQISSIGQQ